MLSVAGLIPAVNKFVCWLFPAYKVTAQPLGYYSFYRFNVDNYIIICKTLFYYIKSFMGVQSDGIKLNLLWPENDVENSLIITSWN